MSEDKKGPSQGVVTVAIVAAIAAILAALFGAYAVLVAAHILPFPFPASPE